MALILENFLIRKGDDSRPAGSSGYAIRIPSVFLSRVADGTEIRSNLKQSKEEQEIMLILEKASCDDFLHISAADWDDTFTEGRADFKLQEAFQNGKRTLLYEKGDVITSPAHSCRITSKR